MPAPAVVVGVEFQSVSISIGRGGTMTLFVTVNNAGGDFSLRLVHTGATQGVLRVTRDDAQVFNFDCDAGSRVLIPNNATIGRTWAQVAQRISVQGGGR